MTINDLAKLILNHFLQNPDVRLGVIGVSHNLRLDVTATETALKYLNNVGDLRYCPLSKTYMLPEATPEQEIEIKTKADERTPSPLEAQERILNFFRKHPQHVISAASLAKFIRIKPDAVRRGLDALSDEGVLVYLPAMSRYTLAKNAKPPVTAKRKPYSITGTAGFKVSGDNVTIFLDRRNNAKSVTLSAAQLQHILDGVQP